MQINPQLKRWNFETRRFKACVCIYIYPCKISSYRSHVTELLMILNSEIRNLEIVFILPVINSRDYIPSSERRICSMPGQSFNDVKEEGVGKLSN